MLRLVIRVLQRILGILGYRIVKRGFMVSSRLGIDPIRDIQVLLNDANFSARLPSPVIECVFDVGANRGDVALDLAAAFPSAVVHAFEPVPDTFKELARQVGAQPRIRTHALALGAHAGSLELNMYVSSVFSSAVSRHAMMSKATSLGNTSVPVSRLDEWCRTNSVDRIDVLKVDTEGYDLEVLKGAATMLADGRVGFIYFEFFRVADDGSGEDGGHLMSIHEYLVSYGYRPVTFYTDFVSPMHTGGIYNALYQRWTELEAAGPGRPT